MKHDPEYDFRKVVVRLWIVLFAVSSLAQAKSIQELDQHFLDSSGDTGAWIFVPKDNVKELSTSEHPGLATIWEAGKGRDIKGILKQPININDYNLPWEFQLALDQSFDAMCGVGSKTQANYAIGMNVALTFSDPAKWPKERTDQPPDTHSTQLLVVHLGNYGESGIGLPQYSNDPSPETYLVWGRGDLGHNVVGDWEIPYIWIGDGAKYGGPASNQLYFRCVVDSPTSIQIGIKFDASHGWNMRRIDCSRFGRITGIWELGPIFSGDRWIPDVLCRSLPIKRGENKLMANFQNLKDHRKTGTQTLIPPPETPNPDYEYYVDYCVFFPSKPFPLEAFSDDFNIPGYMGKWQLQEQGTLADTYSHPGYLQLILIGPGLGTGFSSIEGQALNLDFYQPPWEIEMCFIPPPDDQPWNLWMNWQLRDGNDQPIGSWAPGIMNDPVAGRHRLWPTSFDLVFDPPLPESLLSSKPLYMLIQIIDKAHVCMGFKADANDAWRLSQVYDVRAKLGQEMAILWQHCWSTVTGRRWGAQPGTPMYQKFLIDYVHYRYGLSQ